MYARYSEIRDRLGLKDSAVAKATGIGKSTFSDWKSGRSAPKREKLKKIADYLGVPIEELTGEEITEDHYYVDPEAREMIEFLFNDPRYRVLFDASRKVKPEDIEIVRQILERFYDDSDKDT